MESLTDEERAELGAANSRYDVGCKALRIIDYLQSDCAALRKLLAERTAERAALAAQLEAAETSAALELAKAHAAYKAQVAELTRELAEARQMVAVATLHLDEARSELDHEKRAAAENYASYRSQATRAEKAEAELATAKADDQLSRTQRDVLQAEVGRLKEAVAAADTQAQCELRARQNAVESLSATEAEVTRLTDELKAAKAEDQLSRTQRDELQAEVSRLKEALAAAERSFEDVGELKAAAEARVRELEAEREQSTARASDVLMALGKVESECAALRAKVNELETNAYHRETRIRGLRAEVELLRVALQEGIERSDEELKSLKLAQAIIGAHNVNVAKHAAANALLEDARDAIDEACWPVWWEKWRAYLSSQPTAPTRTEAEQRVLQALDDCRCWRGEYKSHFEPSDGFIKAELARREASRG